MLTGRSLCVALLVVFSTSAAIAQQPAANGGTNQAATKPAPTASSPSPVGLTLVQRFLLMNDINDIDRSRNITPLHLTTDQLRRTIAVLEQLTADYERKVAMLTDKQFSPFMSELKDVKKRVYGGGTIPKDFDARMKHAMDTFVADRKQLNLQNIASASNDIANILTPAQIAAAADIAKNSPANEGMYSDTTTQAQWYHLYVGKVFLSYPRIVPLLQAMLKAQSGGSSAPAGKPKTTQASGSGK